MVQIRIKWKKSISIFILVLLFLSFWQLAEKQKRETSLLTHVLEMEALIPTTNELEKVFQSKMHASFQSREYVRVNKVL